MSSAEIKPADVLRTKLEQVGLPYRSIQCYGSQIVITSKGENTVRKWASLLAKFSTVRGLVQSYDEHSNPTTGTCLKPQRVKVWRVFATIG